MLKKDHSRHSKALCDRFWGPLETTLSALKFLFVIDPQNGLRTPEASCVLAYHDENPKAEIFQFGTTTLIPSGIALKALKGEKLFSAFNRWKLIKDAFSIGAVPAGVIYLKDDLVRKCIGVAGPNSNQTFKEIDAGKVNSSRLLPNNERIIVPNIDDFAKREAACSGLTKKSWTNSLKDPVGYTNCLSSVIENALPNSIVLTGLAFESVK